MFSRFLLLIHVCTAFPFQCPDPAQWSIRAKSLCPNPSKYSCLKNDLINGYSEHCTISDFLAPGRKGVLRGGLDADICSAERYHPWPIKYYTNVSTNCIFLKSVCNEEGQVVYDEGNRITDINCRCDYTRGYNFIEHTRNPCFCVPSEEDCSCYLKTCIDQNYFLSPDYECIHDKMNTSKANCRTITRERVSTERNDRSTADSTRTDTERNDIRKESIPTIAQRESYNRIVVIAFCIGFILVYCIYKLRKKCYLKVQMKSYAKKIGIALFIGTILVYCIHDLIENSKVQQKSYTQIICFTLIIDIILVYCIHELRKTCQSKEIAEHKLQKTPQEDFLTRLIKNIGDCAIQLGIELGITINSVEETIKRYPSDIYGQIADILRKWTQSSTVKPTIYRLMVVLERVDNGGLKFLLEYYHLSI